MWRGSLHAPVWEVTLFDYWMCLIPILFASLHRDVSGNCPWFYAQYFLAFGLIRYHFTWLETKIIVLLAIAELHSNRGISFIFSSVVHHLPQLDISIPHGKETYFIYVKYWTLKDPCVLLNLPIVLFCTLAPSYSLRVLEYESYNLKIILCRLLQLSIGRQSDMSKSVMRIWIEEQIKTIKKKKSGTKKKKRKIVEIKKEEI